MGGAPAADWRAWARVAAAIVGLAVVFLLIVLVRGRDDEASRRCMDDAVGDLRISIYALAEPVTAGTSGADAIADGAFEVRQLPTEFVPIGFVNDLEQIESGIAVADLEENQVLVGSMFSVRGSSGEPTPDSCG